jgi:hypothetical protein
MRIRIGFNAVPDPGFFDQNLRKFTAGDKKLQLIYP